MYTSKELYISLSIGLLNNLKLFDGTKMFDIPLS